MTTFSAWMSGCSTVHWLQVITKAGSTYGTSTRAKSGCRCITDQTGSHHVHHHRDIVSLTAFDVHAYGTWQAHMVVLACDTWHCALSPRRNIWCGPRYENSVDCLQWIPLREDQRTMLLVSAGGDGVLRVWSVAVSGHLMCTLRGATGHLETVKDLCVDDDFRHLVVADSSGHIRMLDILQLDMASPEALAQSFKQVFTPGS